MQYHDRCENQLCEADGERLPNVCDLNSGHHCLCHDGGYGRFGCSRNHQTESHARERTSVCDWGEELVTTDTRSRYYFHGLQCEFLGGTRPVARDTERDEVGLCLGERFPSFRYKFLR